MHKVNLLIFDLDGTLVDSRQDLTNSINYARSALGFQALELAEVMNHVGDGLRKLLHRSLPEAHWNKIEEAIAHFRSHYREHLIDFSILYPGVREVLEHFKSKKMAVISNKPEEFCRMILTGLGVGHYFDLILGGDSLPVMKPSPEPVLYVLNQLEIQPEKAVMIGDSPSDIIAGQQANIFTCAVTYGYRNEELLNKANPDFCLEKAGKLAAIFE